MKRLTKSALIILVFLFGLVQLLPLVSLPKASAVTGSDWNASRIIDDSVFFNPNIMNSQDIQNFLNAKLPTCDTNGSIMYNSTQTRAQWAAANNRPQPPYTCLKDFTQNIPGIAPDAYCNGSVGAGNKSAATIIKEVATACNINPQVILVTLQKEQSLITDDWPWPVQYTKATGMGCPDTPLGVDVDANQNGCYDDYEGFFKQIYYGARQFQRYVKQPDVFNYAVGRTSYIAYQANNPGCGGTNITPQTQATAALYNYTPYQPNAAALNNLYGTGDACSAYGNRNFWRMFSDWFGPTQRNLIKTIWSTGVYLVENGVKRGFPNEETFFSYSYKWSDVLTVSAAEMDSIPLGSVIPYNVNYRNWQLIKTSGSTGVYLVHNGTKRGFPNEETFLSHGYKWSSLVTLSNTEMDLIPAGTSMPYDPNYRNWQLIQTSGSTGVYLVHNGTKRGFQNEETFLSHGYKWADIVTVSNTELGLIPTGAAMPYNPNFRNWQLVKINGSTGVYLVYQGTKRGFPNEETFLSHGYKWSDIVTISSTELGLIPTGADMPYNPNH